MNKFKIILSPIWGNDTVEWMHLQMKVSSDLLPKDKAVLHYPNQAFGGRVPFPVYEDLILRDDGGMVPYEVDDSPTINGHMTYKGIFVKRELQGMLCWSYRIYPRILPEHYASSPYYDFRNEPFGLNGSGYFSFILPNCEEELEVNLHWDMSAMPKEARAIWCYGEGDVTRKLRSQDVASTMYQVGVMNAVENESFGAYWFGNPNFDIASVAKRMIPIFDDMKLFFKDEDARFHVFLRRDPFKKSGGGSACQYAFISGYSAVGTVDLDQWFRTLLHEVVHTWIYMRGESDESTTWFNEGATEYYSTMIPYWGGYLDAKYTASVINDKVNPYYHNIYREMPNEEIVGIQWTDLRAQVIPYGRGFLYLAKVEAQLKRAGKGSINDLVIGRDGITALSTEKWKQFIEEKLGEDGIREFEEMKAGKLILPDTDMFGNDFEVIEKEIELEGKKALAYQWKARI